MGSLQDSRCTAALLARFRGTMDADDEASVCCELTSTNPGAV